MKLTQKGREIIHDKSNAISTLKEFYLETEEGKLKQYPNNKAKKDMMIPIVITVITLLISLTVVYPRDNKDIVYNKGINFDEYSEKELTPKTTFTRLQKRYYLENLQKTFDLELKEYYKRADKIKEISDAHMAENKEEVVRLARELKEISRKDSKTNIQIGLSSVAVLATYPEEYEISYVALSRLHSEMMAMNEIYEKLLRDDSIWTNLKSSIKRFRQSEDVINSIEKKFRMGIERAELINKFNAK